MNERKMEEKGLVPIDQGERPKDVASFCIEGEVMSEPEIRKFGDQMLWCFEFQSKRGSAVTNFTVTGEIEPKVEKGDFLEIQNAGFFEARGENFLAVEDGTRVFQSEQRKNPRMDLSKCSVLGTIIDDPKMVKSREKSYFSFPLETRRKGFPSEFNVLIESDHRIEFLRGDDVFLWNAGMFRAGNGNNYLVLMKQGSAFFSLAWQSDTKEVVFTNEAEKFF